MSQMEDVEQTVGDLTSRSTHNAARIEQMNAHVETLGACCRLHPPSTLQPGSPDALLLDRTPVSPKPAGFRHTPCCMPALSIVRPAQGAPCTLLISWTKPGTRDALIRGVLVRLQPRPRRCSCGAWRLCNSSCRSGRMRLTRCTEPWPISFAPPPRRAPDLYLRAKRKPAPTPTYRRLSAMHATESHKQATAINPSRCQAS